MPVIDLARPLAELAARLGGAERIIADLDETLIMRSHFAAQMARQHLGAEADAEKGFFLFQRYGDPVGLVANEAVAVIGAHWPPEDRRPGVSAERFGQCVAKTGPADVEGISLLLQHVADPSGRGGFGMQDDQNLAGSHDSRG